ncbi:23S rRNA (adenine(2030)-N(6))-methyltransferase RlmJ [Aidingimonas lacisalsi]|uniref:23S rRNA (adenine(2030)-N(6))-methyltransferase RlmJ n=1 Tax=Aidingimonas lacisalsi TaxID=2604086 RepID=UPI0011D2507C|nr:23S rRNA (adenine(2030)-N(6))-methyltransferase RlmJ [Aidingimonas lacisalsi]
MLAYQHAYHAGNMADVHKHLALYGVIRHLHRKASAVTYIDTHAGRGIYPLSAPETRKLAEYRQGVAPLWDARNVIDSDTLLKAWLLALDPLQTSHEGGLTHYPGSPWWLAEGLRSQDRLQLFELHPGEHTQLTHQALPDNVRCRHADGLTGIVEMMPPSTPRVCALIDPSYERKEEYQEVADTLITLSHKVRHAIVLVWYPLLSAGRHHSMLERLRNAGVHKLWRSELRWRAPVTNGHGMYGSGLLVFNPPWGLDERLAASMECVLPVCSNEAHYHADWWMPESS